MATIMQWNIRGLRANWEELHLLIQDLSPRVICLQETMVGHRTNMCPAGYLSLHSPTPADGGHRGGSAIFCRRDVPFSALRLQTPLQAVAGRVYLERMYTVCSLYLPPSEDISRQALEDLLNELPRPVILLGDMNARHHLWGDCTHNTRGTMIAKLMEESDLVVMNTGDPTHFHEQTGTQSVIDLTICSPAAALDFSLDVLGSLRGSDHYPITLQTLTSESAACLPKWCLNRADWVAFQNQCTFNQSAWDFETVDEAVEYLVACVHDAASRSIPRTSGSFRRRPVPWWNLGCAEARRTARRAEARYRRRPESVELKIEYRRRRACYRRVLKEAREESWRTYVGTIGPSTPLNEVWQRVRKMKGRYRPSSAPILNIEGTSVGEPPRVAEYFAAHYSGISRDAPNSPGGNHRRQKEREGVDFSSTREESYNVPFEIRELHHALGLCSDTSPGPDDVPYAMLRHMDEAGLRFLLGLYNRIWREGSFPSSWGIATVIPIPKPGKDNSMMGNFRPISLTSCICKLFERMINFRLTWFLEKGKHISPSQVGFRKLHSTTNALVSMESSICRAFASKKHHVTVFFDLEKAYDTAWRYGILKTLHDLGLRGSMPILIQKFMSNRRIRVRVGTSVSSDHELPGGVPQGSVLSVTLFAVAINNITKALPSGVLSTLYVDDFSISFAASTMAVAERRLQLAIDGISERTTACGFRFSTEKTVAVHFCRTRGVHPDPDLFLYGKRIPCREEARFLGLTFDRRLTWVPHLRSVKTSCLQALNLLKVLSHTTWGADRGTLLYLHETLILSKLEYGSEVYSSATSARLRMLDAVHHAGVRLATGAFRSSPIPSLLVDAGCLPLQLRRRSNILRCWYRLKRTPNSLACRAMTGDCGLQTYNGRPGMPKPLGYRAGGMLGELADHPVPVLEHKVPKICPWRLPEVAICRSVPLGRETANPQSQLVEFLDHLNVHGSSVQVYTDGSKGDSGAGFAVVFPDFNRSFSLPKWSSIFTAELRAILYAITVLLTMPQRHFTIFSDSLSALQALGSWSSGNPLVIEILEWLYLCARRGRRVDFCWVPSHVGIPGNEKADALAKAAAVRPPTARFALPAADTRQAIRQSALDMWQDAWANIGRNKLRTLKPDIKPYVYKDMSRKHGTVLARLRIGHSRMTHAFLMEGAPPPYCEDCIVPLTVHHVVAECPTYVEARNVCLGRHRRTDGSYDLSSILGEDHNSRDIFDFLEEAGLLNRF